MDMNMNHSMKREQSQFVGSAGREDSRPKGKVLLINGSPKENGNTFVALSEVAKTLNSEGVETEIISIGKKAVQGCIACGMCGRTGKCTFNDDLYYKVLRTVKEFAPIVEQYWN